MMLDFRLTNKTPSKEEIMTEASRCLNCKKPGCVLACPINNMIPEFIFATKNGNFKEAYEIISKKSMLPMLCGALCPHEKQCQGGCIRNKIDRPVSIGQIERFVGELALDSGWDKAVWNKNNNKKVLVVGSGPAGLSASYYLSKSGYSVTVLEKNEYIGGVLKHGIPSFRFDFKVVEKIVSHLKEIGVNFKTNTALFTDISLEEAKKEYKSIFLGTGTNTPNKMNIPGINLDGVVYANTFLRNVNLLECDDNYHKKYQKCGEHVVVVGGGNVAMDAARVAIRLEQVKDVTIIYRRTINEMPASKSELSDALDEGIKFLELTNPVKIIGKNRVQEIECAKMVLSDPDESGRRKPVESGEPNFKIKADTLILALGYVNDKQVEDIKVGKWNNIIIDEDGMTSIEDVYAGGDNVTGSLTVVSAMAAGLTAAKAIIEKGK